MAPQPYDEADGGEQLRIDGLVQGVGMRPTIWRLAQDLGLCGTVCNDGDAVLARLWGARAQRDRFVVRLREDAPPQARIRTLTRQPLTTPAPVRDFRIVESRAGEVHAAVLPDLATCAQCVAEIGDPTARRYRHAFANCTHCGPRLSVMRAFPYDRIRTSMAPFAMCPECQAEFVDPRDRRFHAQPIACPHCGPRLWLEDAAARECAQDRAAIEHAARALANGLIVAIKGIGGFHLAVDAAQVDAVTRLRALKQRPHKPFALMAGDIATIRRYCIVPDSAVRALESAAAPVVLLDAAGVERLPDVVAPLQHRLGFMLPHSPLHHLLLQACASRIRGPLVMTSGNRSGTPVCTDNDQARSALADIADLWLMHDRAIVNRVDDSVVFVADGAARVLRRSRGYAPAPIAMPAGFAAAPPLFAAGAQLKNCLAVLVDGQAVLSQHIGDLHDAGVTDDYERVSTFYRGHAATPAAIVVDRHPDYAASAAGRALAASTRVPLHTVQHHHAHAAACMAENGVEPDAPPLLALVLDGAGYGDDGTIWGGELLRCDYRRYVRLGRLRPVGLPGGAAAMREPWRCAYAYLHACGLWPLSPARRALPTVRALADRPWPTLDAMLQRRINCPTTSSAGRLFDAVAALLGLCPQRISFEAQAAMALEACVEPDAAGSHPFALHAHDGLLELDWAPMFATLLDDLRCLPAGAVAARFHRGLVEALCTWVRRAAGDTRTVALSGGVFQNVRVLEGLTAALRRDGFTVLTQREVPCNDGGLALGQLAVAAARILAGDPADTAAEEVSCV